MNKTDQEDVTSGIRRHHWIKAGRPVKRSVTIAGHKTSFSLEEPFWLGLQEIAESRGESVSEMISSLDELRFLKEANIGLSGAIRSFVMRFYVQRLSRCGQTTAMDRIFGVVKEKNPQSVVT